MLCKGQASFKEQFQELGQGTRFKVFDQDPSVTEENIGIGTLFFPRKINAGPKDLFAQIVQTPVKPNASGDFTDYKPGTAEFDSAHTFAIVSGVYQMYSQDLTTLSNTFPKSLVLGKAKKIFDKPSYPILKITPKAGEEENAYYSRESDGSRSLMFFSFKSETDKKTRIHTCQSADVVAHETGHSFLDLLHPEYFDSQSLQTGGLHEAFGDITALFWSLSQYRQCQSLLNDTKGDLHKPNFWSALAEQFGLGIGNKSGLRNADDDLVMSKVEPEVHEVSRVFTGAIYDIYVDGFKAVYQLKKDQESPINIVNNAGTYLRRLFLQALVESTNPEPTFSTIGSQMFALATARAKSPTETLDTLGWANFIKSQFTKRGIPVSSNPQSLRLAHHPLQAKKKRVCGTLVKSVLATNQKKISAKSTLTPSIKKQQLHLRQQAQQMEAQKKRQQQLHLRQQAQQMEAQKKRQQQLHLRQQAQQMEAQKKRQQQLRLRQQSQQIEAQKKRQQQLRLRQQAQQMEAQKKRQQQLRLKQQAQQMEAQKKRQQQLRLRQQAQQMEAQKKRQQQLRLRQQAQQMEAQKKRQQQLRLRQQAQQMEAQKKRQQQLRLKQQAQQMEAQKKRQQQLRLKQRAQRL
jgi:hypothetical protein